MGHNEPVVVGDCGLTAAQRELLAPHCKLFELQLVRNPTQYKPFPFLLRPQGTIVLIDSDMSGRRFSACLARRVSRLM
jgi:hypothetical protein